jgi:hypothetical protein
MQLEQQVCSVELARKLKELGVKQKSHFWWSRSWIESFENQMDWKLCRFGETFNEITRCSAFTAAELGEMLPHNHASQRKDIPGKKGEGVRKEWIAYHLVVDETQMVYERGDTEANARATLLTHLLEKGMIACP